MPTITIKNIPDALYERLKRRAQMNRRSINSEIIVCLERALYSQRVDPEALLARARQLRQKTAGHIITDAEFTRAKTEGRP
ncbi:MAG TPA: Arc family DNA-binding protein [Caldilineae bacterium]|jgi:plasmid stability protein|nr:Arc family DNA-binding protein [Caldilineae bacterium]